MSHVMSHLFLSKVRVVSVDCLNVHSHCKHYVGPGEIVSQSIYSKNMTYISHFLNYG